MAIFYTKKEELLNAWSHGAGVVMGIVAGVLMLVWCGTHQGGWASFGVSLYLFGMLSSYVASTLYHAWPSGRKGKEVLRRWDHAAIYWHIAGSYSPLTLIALWHEGAWGVGLFIFIWTCALAGTVASFRHLQEHSNAETACFVLMGLSASATSREPSSTPCIDGHTCTASSTSSFWPARCATSWRCGMC